MKISIITATYNSAGTVKDTFESILRQTYKDYECIVIDGASKDETVDIIREYEPLFDGRMRWLTESDSGMYDAINKGIAMASGEVVGVLNSDDFYASDDVLKTISEEFAKDEEVDAVYGDVTYVERENTEKKVRYYSSKIFRRSLMRLGFMPAHPSFYCKKNVYERFKLDLDYCKKVENWRGSIERGYFNTSYKIAADFENLLRMIFVGRIKTKYIGKNCVTMRTGGASSSGIASHKQINRDHLRAFKENDVYSNIALLSLRYVYKIGELLISR